MRGRVKYFFGAAHNGLVLRRNGGRVSSTTGGGSARQDMTIITFKKMNMFL